MTTIKTARRTSKIPTHLPLSGPKAAIGRKESISRSEASSGTLGRKGHTQSSRLEPFAIEKYDADPELGFLVFENANVLMGLDCLGIKERHAFVKFIFVAEEDRGNGVASGVLEFVTRRSNSLGIASVLVEYPDMADDPERALMALKARGFKLHSSDGKRTLYRKAL